MRHIELAQNQGLQKVKGLNLHFDYHRLAPGHLICLVADDYPVQHEEREGVFVLVLVQRKRGCELALHRDVLEVGAVHVEERLAEPQRLHDEVGVLNQRRELDVAQDAQVLVDQEYLVETHDRAELLSLQHLRRRLPDHVVYRVVLLYSEGKLVVEQREVQKIVLWQSIARESEEVFVQGLVEHHEPLAQGGVVDALHLLVESAAQGLELLQKGLHNFV